MVFHNWLTRIGSFLSSPHYSHIRRLRDNWTIGMNAAVSQVTSLEHRILLSALVVDTLTDEADGNTTAGRFSLREAIEYANTHAGADQITFASHLQSGVIRLDENLGSLQITDDLSINGRISLDAQDKLRILNAGKNAGSITVSLTGLTFAHGAAQDGGGIRTQNTNLSINSATFFSNVSGAIQTGQTTLAGAGGAMHIDSGTVTISDTDFIGNQAVNGGAVYASGTVSFERTTMSSNFASNGGGAIECNATATISESSFTSNTASGFAGAISNFGTLKIYNSTLARNVSSTTVADSGASALENYAQMTIVNSTIAENQIVLTNGNATQRGAVHSVAGTTTLFNTIVIGSNSGIGNIPSADVSGPLSANSANNLIGSGSLVNGVQQNIVGAAFSDTLLPLASNQSRTLSYVLTPWSRAIDAGSNLLGIGPTGQPLTRDQRGGGFARRVDGNVDGVVTIDIGAIEAAIYEQPLIVKSTDDDVIASPAGFNVLNGQTFSPGTLSLREAITIAGRRSGKETITFDSALFAQGERKIVLSEELVIDDDLTISGPGSELLVLDGSDAMRHFSVGVNRVFELSGMSLVNGFAQQGGSIFNAGRKLVLRDITASNNRAVNMPNSVVNPEGAVVHNAREDSSGQPIEIDSVVEVYSSRFLSNRSDNFGGVFRMFLGDQLTIDGSIFVGNSANNGGVTANGGGIIQVSNSLFVNNRSNNGGGALRSFGPTTVLNSSFVGNVNAQAEGGGAIYVVAKPLYVMNCTFSGNSAETGGSAIHGPDSGEFATIVNSTVINNSTITDGVPGGGIAGNQVRLINTIVAGNRLANLPGEIATGALNIGASFNNIVQNTATAGGLANNVNGNKLGIDPLLAPLTLAGNQYFASPLAGSPAINSGSTSRAIDQNGNRLRTDQRGLRSPRIIGSAVDIGAIETNFQAGAVVLLDGTAANDRFTLTYSSTTPTGTVTVTMSSNGGAIATLGTFPMSTPLTIDGLAGADTALVVGTPGADAFVVNTSSVTVNGAASLILSSIENRTLTGGAASDVYKFDADASLGLFTLDESGGGTDTIDFSLTTAVGLSLNLELAVNQRVHANLSLGLGSAGTFENVVGGSGADTLTGNSLSNSLTGGPGDDSLNGNAGSDLLFGGANNDTYMFVAASVAEADQVTENVNEGIDTLNFAYLTTQITLNLGSTAVQAVHVNRTLKLNSISTFENAVGGTGSDTLLGNVLPNRLTGGNGDNILVGLEAADILEAGSGRDILIGGLGLDILNGGDGDDVLIAGRSTNDSSLTNLSILRTQWISANTYTVRISNLRAGVGSPAVSLKSRINVLNDGGEDDVLAGGTGTDWYFRALDDVISGLVSGEIIDLL